MYHILQFWRDMVRRRPGGSSSLGDFRRRSIAVGIVVVVSRSSLFVRYLRALHRFIHSTSAIEFRTRGFGPWMDSKIVAGGRKHLRGRGRGGVCYSSVPSTGFGRSELGVRRVSTSRPILSLGRGDHDPARGNAQHGCGVNAFQWGGCHHQG
jgi:hypothetical protein